MRHLSLIRWPLTRRRSLRKRHRLARLLTRRRIAAALFAILVVVPAALVVARRQRPRNDPLAAASLLLTGGDGAAAEPYVRQALDRRPRDAVAWHLLGECLRLRNLTSEADVAYRQARALAPAWDAPAVALAVRALADGRRAQARRLIDETLQRGANTAAVLRLRGRLRAQDADFTGAAQDLTAAASARGGRARDVLESIRHERAAAFVAGLPDPDAEDRLRAAEHRAETEPDRTAVQRAIRLARGDVLDAPAQDDEACVHRVIALDRAGRLLDALEAARSLAPGVSVDAMRRVAAALSPQDAVRLMALLTAVRAAPGEPSAERLAQHETNAHLAAARGRATSDHAEVTIAHLRELALQHPEDPDVAFALGTRLGVRGDAVTALDLAERAPEGATGAAGRRLLGWFHVGAGESRRAQSFLLPAGLPTEAHATLPHVLAAARADGPTKAAEQARETLRRSPDDARARLLLGLVAAHTGDDASACLHLAGALARDPSLAVAANDLAWSLTRRGARPDLAAPLTDWALHLAPSDPHVRDTHSEVQRRLRRTSPSSERTPR